MSAEPLRPCLAGADARHQDACTDLLAVVQSIMGKASRQQAAVRPLLYALAASLVGGLVYGIAVSLNRQNAKPVGAPGAVAGPVTARVPVRALGKALDPEVAQYGLPDGTSFLPEYKNP